MRYDQIDQKRRQAQVNRWEELKSDYQWPSNPALWSPWRQFLYQFAAYRSVQVTGERAILEIQAEQKMTRIRTRWALEELRIVAPKEYEQLLEETYARRQ